MNDPPQETMAGQNHRASSPSTLQEPLSRNVQLLLESRVPARLAWNDAAGQPRVAPLWFRWRGSLLELSAFVGSRKVEELHDGDPVAVTIDTDEFSYRSLRVRRPVSITRGQGLTSSYGAAARRCLGNEPARDWCDRLRGADQVLPTVQPAEGAAPRMWGAPYLREPASPR